MFNSFKRILFLFLLSTTAAFSYDIPKEINYRVVKVRSLKDLNKKQDGNFVYSLDGLELKKLNIPTKKKVFISLLLPSIDIVNKKIDRDIDIVKNLSKKKKYTEKEKKELNKIFTKYKVKTYDFKELDKRMIKYPTSLILAQGSLESGWGTSRIFSHANNLFGMYSFNKKEPRMKSGNRYVRKFNSIEPSVENFVLTLSRVPAYRGLRASIKKGEDARKISKHLTKYSTRKGGYIRAVNKMIDHNDFIKYDK